MYEKLFDRFDIFSENKSEKIDKTYQEIANLWKTTIKIPEERNRLPIIL